MATAMFQPMILVIELLAVIQLVRYWKTLRWFRHFDQVIGMSTNGFMADVMALYLFVVQLALTLHDWFGLPLDAVGVASHATPYLTWVIFGSFLLLMMTISRNRLDNDAALHTISALKAMNGNPTTWVQP